MLSRTPCAARINCRQRRSPLTGGTHHTKTARRARVRSFRCSNRRAAVPRHFRPNVTHYTHGSTAQKGAPAVHDQCHDHNHLMARFLTK
jgi:hypothetical protein